MKIEQWNLSDIKPYPNNPRVNDAAVDAVAKSIQEFGFRVPLVVDKEGVIVCGHTRYKAALKLGLEKVPVHVAKDLTPEQIKAYRIADNKTAELAEWNYELLPIELSELKAADFDLQFLGFSKDELAKLMDPGVKDGLCDPDEMPEPPDEATTQPGDLWILGDHRLLCGDRTSATWAKPSAPRRTGLTISHLCPPFPLSIEPSASAFHPAGRYGTWIPRL